MKMNKNNFNLGYVVPNFPEQTHIFFWREIKALTELGINVHLISTTKNDPNKIKHDFAKSASQQCHYIFPPSVLGFLRIFISFGWLISVFKYIFKLDLKLSKKIRLLAFIPSAADALDFSIKNNINHIHGHSCADVAHILAMISFYPGKTYSLTLHGGLDTYGTSHKEKMSRAKFVSTVTNPLRNDVHELVGVELDRIPVITMGVDLDKFNIKDYEAKDKVIKLNFITVARLDIGKGHQFSLEALSKLKKEGLEFHYNIIGGGYYEPQIVEMINSLDLKENVTIHGSVSENTIKEMLNSSDIFLLTSAGVFEAAPVSVMEAMATGLPIICSIIGGTPDMVSHGENGYLTPQKDVSAIYNAMKNFFDNPARCKSMGMAARETAQIKFCYKKQAKLLLENIVK